MRSLARDGVLPLLFLLGAYAGCGSDPAPKSEASTAGTGGDAVPGAAGTSVSAGRGGSVGVAGAGGSSAGASGRGGAGGGQGGSGGGVSMPDEDAPSHEVTFEPSDEVILNPERGFYATTNLVDDPDLSGLRASGVTLVHSYVRLDAYRTSDLPSSLLEQVTAGFERARMAGVKVILRFAYNFGPYPNSEPDAPKSWVLTHIGQLKPLLEANADVIAVVQAGFIGAWGEWHTSTNNLTEPAARKEILETLVSAVPVTRSVQLRYPPYKRALYGDALTAADAFGTTLAARVGHHNDCFVSSDNDVGTYPDDEVDVYRDYVGADSAFVPMGGETCAVSAPRSECASALAEMEKLHFSYINREFHEGVLASWSSCMTEMQRRLGYRLGLLKASLPAQVKPGGSFTLRVELENSGYAAPFNARPVDVVLHGAGVELRQRLLTPEPRRWLKDGAFEARLRLPSDLPPGDYQLALRLPDAAPKLADEPDYSLRFANAGVWDEMTGENVLGTLSVDAGAPGTSVSDATDLQVLAEGP